MGFFPPHFSYKLSYYVYYLTEISTLFLMHALCASELWSSGEGYAECMHQKEYLPFAQIYINFLIQS